MPAEKKYKMSMSLNVLNHLGMNLYSNIPAVLSEVVANSYDADSTKVDIKFEEDQITITDNGNGMSLQEINDKYLYVGYEKREHGEAFSPRYKRPVMGRKGIGKLSLFSIANEIEVHTVKINSKSKKIEKNGLTLKRSDIIDQIKKKGADIYYPNDVRKQSLKITKGTKIILRDFKKNINHAENFLKKRLARRFSIIGKRYRFEVCVNDEPITVMDRDYFKKIQFIWLIGNDDYDILSEKDLKIKKTTKLNGKLDDGSRYEISGWIGAVGEAGDLDSDGTNNNKISIFCRGKMAQEDILESFNEGGIYATYLIGEITADFLDLNEMDDIATSSRQRINEDDPRYLALQERVYTILKDIQKVWSGWRLEVAQTDAVERAERFNPVLKKWFDSLKTESSRTHAKKLFATIESMHFDKTDEREKKRELYAQGILAFEKLKLKDALHDLEKFTNADDPKLSILFNDLSDIEANLYYDIAIERIAVIREFQRKLEANDKETLLQKYLFDNLWLMNPSWERATAGSEVMEKRVESAFKKVIKTLTDEERKGRIDIKYRTAGGKHIIVELKRYKPTYKVDQFVLARQASKYRDALLKCLENTDESNGAIEILIVLGSRVTKTNKDEEDFLQSLRPYNARVIYYDYLIEESLKSYSQYIDKQKEISRIRGILDQL